MSSSSEQSTPQTTNDLNLMVNDLLQQMVRQIIIVITRTHPSMIDSFLRIIILSYIYIHTHTQTNKHTQQTRFDSVGRNIETRLVDMDQRMTELETSLQELMEQAGLQGTPKNTNTTSSNHNKAQI